MATLAIITFSVFEAQAKTKTKKIEIPKFAFEEQEVKEDHFAEIIKKSESLPKETSVDEVRQAVELASEKTGVRKDFLMGMLVVESDLGRNTGKCTYSEVEKGAEDRHRRGALGGASWENFKQRRETFKGIADDLGYDYEKLKVSCNPPYAGTGGAMGLGQFMPDTWLEYNEKVASILKKDHADPWEARDAIMAMALKVADVPGVTQHNLYSERSAAKMYLSGSTSSKYEWYASQILYWAENYEKILS